MVSKSNFDILAERLEKVEARHSKKIDSLLELTNKALTISAENAATIKEMGKSFDRIYKLTLAILGSSALMVLGYFVAVVLNH